MAEEIGLKIAVQGDREFQKQLTDIRKELKLTDSELDKLSALYAENGKSMEALKSKSEVYSRQIELQNQKVEAARKALENWSGVQKTAGAEADRLKGELQKAREEMSRMEQATGTTSEELEEQKKKIASLQDELSGAEKAYDTAGKRTQEWQLSLNRAETDLLKTENALKSTSDEMGKLGGQTKTAEQKIDEFAQAAQRCGDKIQSIGSKTAGIGKDLSKYLTVPIIGAAGAAVKFASDFEQSSAKVATIADTTAASMEELNQGVLELSNQTGEAASDLNEALYQVISATGDTGNALDYVEIATKAAIGGFTDTATAVDGLTTIMNNYGLKGKEAMQEIADQMLVAQNFGKTTFGELASAMGQVVPIAGSLDLTTGELMATMATLTKNGIATSQAVTGLKGALSNIIKPSTQAAEAAETLGLDFSAAALQSKGLQGFLQDVRAALEDAAPEYAKASDRVAELKNQIASAEAANASYAQQLSAEKGELSELREQRTQASKELQKQIDEQQAVLKSLRESKKTASAEEKKQIDAQIADQQKVVDSLKATKKESLEAIGGQIDAQSALAKSVSAQGTAAGASKQQISAWKKELEAAEKQLEFLGDAADSPIAGFSELFGSVEGLNSVMVLTSETGAKDLTGALEAMGESAGAVESAYDTTTKTFERDTKKLQNSVKNLGIDIGRQLLPYASKLIVSIQGIVDKFAAMDDGTKENIVRIGLFAAALGPVLSVTGKVATGIGSLTKSFGAAVSGTKDFVQGLRGIPTAAGETVSAAGKLGSALSSIGGGPVLLGIAAATAAIGALALATEGLRQKLVDESWGAYAQNVGDAFQRFHDQIQNAQGVLSDFDISSIFSAEEQAAVENGIQECQDKVLQIAQTAAEESRQLTDEERKQIEELVGMIDSYISQKLQAYQTQQMVVLEMAKREKEITSQVAADLIKSAEDTKDKTLSIAKSTCDQKYNQAADMYHNQKIIDENEFNRLLDQAEKEYNLQKDNAEKITADTYAIILAGYDKENSEAHEQLKKVEETFKEKAALEKKYNDIMAESRRIAQKEGADAAEAYTIRNTGTLNALRSEMNAIEFQIMDDVKNLNSDYSAEWLSIALKFEENGGKLTQEQRQTAQNIVDAFSNMPADLRAKAEEGMQQFGLGFDENGDLVYNSANGAKQRVMDALYSLPDELGSLGRAAATSLADGLRSESEQVRAAAAELVSQINAGGAQPGMLENATIMGQYYRDGYTNSLRSGASEAYKAGRQFTESSVKGGQAGIDSHSPSRATQKLGRYFGQGYQLGITEELHKTAELGKKLAQAALPRLESGSRIPSSLSDSLKPPKTESTAITGSTYQPKPPQTTRIIINLDGKQIGETVAPTVSRTIQVQASAIARGRGNPLV